MTTDHPVEAPANPVPLTSKIGRGHSIRCWLIMLVCLVLGLWGVYDYVWAIPMQAEQAERRELSQEVLELLEMAASPGNDTETRNQDVALLTNRLKGMSTTASYTPESLDGLPPTSDEAWMVSREIYVKGLESRPIPTGGPSEAMRMAGTVAERSMDLYGDAQAPSVYDRPVQWLFIISLACIPFYAWSLLTYSPRKYRLDEDGTLYLPEGTWSQDEIADIDMSRWMSKSTAWVEHVDGTRVKLDAHIFKNLHLIIGTIAHRFHPDKWEEDGRKIKPGASLEPPSDEEQDS